MSTTNSTTTAAEQDKQQAAALLIQNAQRQKLAKEEVERRRKARRDAANKQQQAQQGQQQQQQDSGEKDAAALRIQASFRQSQAKAEVESKIAQRKRDKAAQEKAKQEEEAVLVLQSHQRQLEAEKATTEKIEIKKRKDEELSQKQRAARVLQCAQRQALAREEIVAKKLQKQKVLDAAIDARKRVYRLSVELTEDGLVKITAGGGEYGASTTTNTTNPDGGAASNSNSDDDAFLAGLPQCFFISPQVEIDAKKGLLIKKKQVVQPPTAVAAATTKKPSSSSPAEASSSATNTEQDQQAPAAAESSSSSSLSPSPPPSFLPTTSSDTATQKLLDGITSFIRHRESQALGEQLDLMEGEEASAKSKSFYVDGASGSTPLLKHCQLLLHQLQETVKGLEMKVRRQRKNNNNSSNQKNKTASSGGSSPTAVDLSSRDMQHLLLIETGASALLRKETISSRPTMLQVIYSGQNSELDVVRQNNDASRRIMVERLPMSLPYVTEQSELKEKGMDKAEQRYNKHFERCKSKGYFDFMHSGGLVPDGTADEADDASSDKKKNADGTGGGDDEEEVDTASFHLSDDDSEDEQSSPSPANTTATSTGKQQQKQKGELDTIETVAFKRKQLKKLSALLLHKEASAQEHALWRENKALLQFCLEILHSAESHVLPITKDEGRTQQPLILLKTVRANLARLEEKFNVNRKASNMTGGGKRGVTATTVEQQQELGAERLRLYRELELLRGSETVLEACLQEKQMFLQLLQRDRYQFVSNIKDNRDLLKKKDEEIQAGIVANTALRKQLQASEEKNKSLQKSFNDEKFHIEELYRNLAAVKEKRRFGEVFSPSKSHQQKSDHSQPHGGVVLTPIQNRPGSASSQQQHQQQAFYGEHYHQQHPGYMTTTASAYSSPPPGSMRVTTSQQGGQRPRVMTQQQQADHLRYLGRSPSPPNRGGGSQHQQYPLEHSSPSPSQGRSHTAMAGGYQQGHGQGHQQQQLDRTAPITPYDIVVDPKKRPKLQAEEQSKLLTRLYEQEMKKILNPPEVKDTLQNHVEPIEISEFNQRLYYKRLQMHEQNQASLLKKYQGEGTVAHSPQVSKAQHQEIITKFGVTRVKDQEAKKKIAFEKLVLARDKPPPKLSDEQRQETCERLYAMAEGKRPPPKSSAS